jgi:hypothetical protein
MSTYSEDEYIPRLGKRVKCPDCGVSTILLPDKRHVVRDTLYYVVNLFPADELEQLMPHECQSM